MRGTRSGARYGVTAAVTVTAVAALGMSAPAQAAEACKTSSKSIDTPTYSGPWPDNWKFTVKACAKRSGGRVAHWAKVSWDLPASVFTPGGIFNSPGTGVSVTGKRPSGRAAGVTRWTDLRERLDRARDGAVTTPAFTTGHGAGQAVTSVVVELDWKNDGKAPVRYVFTTSPRV
ncbi:hypothetical protein [Streptomyces sp. NPDC054952]